MDTDADHVAMIPSSSLSSSSAGVDHTPTTGALGSLNAADSSDITSLPVTQEQDEPTSVPPTPTTSAAVPVDGDAHAQGEGPLFTFVLALLAYCATVMVAVLAESKDTVSTLWTAAKVLWGITAVLAIGSLAVGIMAAGYHAAVPVPGNNGNLRVSAFCARLCAILSSVLLVVALCCKLGRWGCITGVPSGAVIAAMMGAVWIWGDERAAAQAVANCLSHIKDLCPRCLSRPPSTTDVQLPGRGGDGSV